jgi:hypothetical protein
MERLLMLRLRASGCAAEARLNDIAVARTAAAGGDVSVPVHEFLLEGENHLALVLDPPPPGATAAPRLLDAPIVAGVRLLLPRVGHVGSEATARSLAELELAVPAGEVHQPPNSAYRAIELPIKFPRWRWLDLPLIEDPAAEQALVASFVQALAIALARGDADAFVQAARLRFEELALAYQQQPADLVARWRSRIQLLFATKALKMVLPALSEVVLLPCAGGRMVECVSPSGEPILRTQPAADGSRQAWPIRVAVIDGRCHVVR